MFCVYYLVLEQFGLSHLEHPMILQAASHPVIDVLTVDGICSTAAG